MRGTEKSQALPTHCFVCLVQAINEHIQMAAQIKPLKFAPWIAKTEGCEKSVQIPPAAVPFVVPRSK